MKGHSVMVNYSSMIGCCEKMCNFFTKKKEKCPVFLTAKYNSHFGIYNKKKNKEIAGFDMHGNHSINAAYVVLIAAVFTAMLWFSGVIDKLIFKLKFKKR